MKEQVDIKAIKKLARQFANGESDWSVDMWPTPVSSRQDLGHYLAEYVGLPKEHRRRVYYKTALLAALNAYDIRMAQRQRHLEKTRARFNAWMKARQEGRR